VAGLPRRTVQQPAPAATAITYNPLTHYAQPGYVYEEPKDWYAYWEMQQQIVIKFNREARRLGLNW
jgi:hypothetical protein